MEDRGDLICLVGEHYDESDDLTIFDPQATWKKSTLAGGTYTMRELLVPIFIKGQCVYKSPPVMDIRSYCKDELNTLWDESRRLVNPQEVYVDLSMPLYKLRMNCLMQITKIKSFIEGRTIMIRFFADIIYLFFFPDINRTALSIV